jgi:hypothetical protein
VPVLATIRVLPLGCRARRLPWRLLSAPDRSGCPFLSQDGQPVAFERSARISAVRGCGGYSNPALFSTPGLGAQEIESLIESQCRSLRARREADARLCGAGLPAGSIRPWWYPGSERP